jgi:glycosyltransferase involved in cell wall biosynthesis
VNHIKKIVFFVSEDWYFCSHRINLAKAAIEKGYKVSLITRVGNHGEMIREAGIELIPVNIERSKLNIFSDIKLLFKLTSIIRYEKPDIFHCVAVKPVLYGSIAALFFPKTQVVNALGGLGYVFSSSNLKAKVLRPFIKNAFKYLLGRRGNQLIVQNKDDYELFSDKFTISRKQISLIRGAGVDNQYLQELPEPELPIKVTLLARMLVDKGVNEFVEAAKILKERGFKGELILVGDPDPLNPASIDQRQLKKWDESGLVEWNRFNSNVQSVWSNSHISVLPSYREGLPKSLLESAACGRAIVTTDVPGCREVVTDGVNGILVPVKDPIALADAIAKLSNDKELRVKMGKAGRKLIDEELSADKVHAQILKLYKDLLI